MLLAKPLEDFPAGMPLLVMRLLVRFKDFVDDRDEAADRWFFARLGSSIAGRLLMGQDFLNSPKVQVELPGGFPPAHLAAEHGPADFGPKIHVSDHSFPSRF